MYIYVHAFMYVFCILPCFSCCVRIIYDLHGYLNICADSGERGISFTWPPQETVMQTQTNKLWGHMH